jgi:hypothetical protein
MHLPPQASSSASVSASGADAGDALLSAEKFAAGEVVAALQAPAGEMEAAARPVPAGFVAGVVAAVQEPATARLGMKVLLIMLLEEGMAGLGGSAIGILAAIYGGGGGGGGEEDRAESPPPPEVVKAVVAVMQVECSARGRRKGKLQLCRGATQPARRAGAPPRASTAGRASLSSATGQRRRASELYLRRRPAPPGKRVVALPQARAAGPASWSSAAGQRGWPGKLERREWRAAAGTG